MTIGDIIAVVGAFGTLVPTPVPVLTQRAFVQDTANEETRVIDTGDGSLIASYEGEFRLDDINCSATRAILAPISLTDRFILVDMFTGQELASIAPAIPFFSGVPGSNFSCSRLAESSLGSLNQGLSVVQNRAVMFWNHTDCLVVSPTKCSTVLIDTDSGAVVASYEGGVVWTGILRTTFDCTGDRLWVAGVGIVDAQTGEVLHAFTNTPTSGVQQGSLNFGCP